MQNWEYMTLGISNVTYINEINYKKIKQRLIIDLLNQLGSEGWEVITSAWEGRVIILRRQING